MWELYLNTRSRMHLITLLRLLLFLNKVVQQKEKEQKKKEKKERGGDANVLV